VDDEPVDTGFSEKAGRNRRVFERVARELEEPDAVSQWLAGCGHSLERTPRKPLQLGVTAGDETPGFESSEGDGSCGEVRAVTELGCESANSVCPFDHGGPIFLIFTVENSGDGSCGNASTGRDLVDRNWQAAKSVSR